MTTSINSTSGEKGFTLVELSIVMIIIGLLIGGILKGQELVANARLSATISKAKAIEAAINTFRDSYQGLPGDINNAQNRLPGCLAATKCGAIAANTAGLGNNQIGVGPGLAQGAASENVVAWGQLAATDMLGGIKNTAAADTTAVGDTNPSGEIGGMFAIGYTSGAALTASTLNAAVRAGHYLALRDVSAADAAAAGQIILTPSQASRIDTKLDDGAPNTGAVMASGSNTTCASGNATTATYVTTADAAVCGLYIRIQQ